MFIDSLTLDAPKPTKDGYLAVRARAARTGVYEYSGREIDPDNAHGLRDKAVVHVLRDEQTVFDEAAARSFIGKPVTDDHPTDAVTAENWRDHARGMVMGAMRDGDYLAFDLLLTDAVAIAKVNAGKRELSNGYSADLKYGSFTAADGTLCEARQASISGNHVALVDAGRAGSECRIADAAKCISPPQEFADKWLADERTYDESRDEAKNKLDDAQNGDAKVPKIILVDGHQIDISNVDVAEATIKTLQDKATAASQRAEKAEADVATLTTDKATADAKVTTLEKQLADSKPTPAMLRDAAKRYADTLGKANALGVKVADDADEAQIMQAVVADKLGDLAKDWSAEQVAASFAALAKDVKADDKLADGIRGVVRQVTDAKSAIEDSRRAFLARKESAYIGVRA